MKRVWLARISLAIGAPLIVLCAAELVLRLVWSNPYRPATPVDEFGSRLAMPWSRATVNVEGLYEGGGWLYGETTPLRSLSNGRSSLPTPVLAIGGSTTQAMLVPEGERWPDLLEPPAMNFGVESNCIIDSYRNLRFLLEESGLRPERILVMHGVNDLTEILRGPDNFGLEKLPHRMHLIPLEGEAKRKVLGISVRDSALLSWLSFNLFESLGRDITRAAPISEVPVDAPTLTQNQVQAFVAYLETALPARDEVFDAIASLAIRHGAELVLMTQPHAMRPDYQPYLVERRMRRNLGDQFMSHAQHALLLDLLNQHTRDAASRLNAPLIDLAQCFEPLDPTPLFYDGVHYTPRGSMAVVKCVNEAMPPLRSSTSR